MGANVAGGYCRKCGTTTAPLERWHSILVCPACRPVRRCLDCGRTAREVSFTPAKARRCDPCLKASGKPRKPEPRPIVVARLNLKHVAWVRAQGCFLHLPECVGLRVHAHHERRGSSAGWGRKPDDRCVLPLCARHHAEGHNGGWRTFEKKYACDLIAVALDYAERSPYLPLDPDAQKVFPTALTESEKAIV